MSFVSVLCWGKLCDILERAELRVTRLNLVHSRLTMTLDKSLNLFSCQIPHQ